MHTVSVCRSDCDIVYPTETTRYRASAVMARWASKNKRTARGHVIRRMHHRIDVGGKRIVLSATHRLHLSTCTQGATHTCNDTVDRFSARAKCVANCLA